MDVAELVTELAFGEDGCFSGDVFVEEKGGEIVLLFTGEGDVFGDGGEYGLVNFHG